ncbi:MAG: hypothetical protein ACREQD_06435 [Candidatus Binataceae bacterium]
MRLYERGQTIWECSNIFVNAGLPALANLIAGISAGQYVSALGYGSSGLAPAATDTGLNATPAYYNSVGSHTFPSSGSVQFNYSLLTTDYGANGIAIQELGLFANSANVALPAVQGSANPAWTAGAAKSAGSLLVDGNGNLQRCTTGGTTGGAAPAWSTTLNGATADGSVTWTLVAFHQGPGPLIAHVNVPAFGYTGTGNYSGTWTLTF